MKTSLLFLSALLCCALSSPRHNSKRNLFEKFQFVSHFVNSFDSLSLVAGPSTLAAPGGGSDKSSESASLECTACKGLVSLLQELFLKNATEKDIEKAVTKFCIDFKVEDDNVCRAVVLEFKDEALTVFDEISISPDEVCGVIVGPSCGSPYDPFNQTWTIKLPSTPKPPVKPILPPKAGSPITKILFLSDIHFDKNYTPGYNAECGEPLCCRPPNGPPPPGKRAAGPWGDYNCDCPLSMLENLFSHLKNISSEFDWVYLTGDLPAHNVWNQTRDDQLYILKVITEFFQKYLPGKTVYPALGNHESAPVDSFPPLTITGPNSNQWLRDALAQYWSTWLPSDTMATIKKGGYYTALIRKGLRVVSLNMNYCNSNNWWLYINSTDPAQQLEWLVDVLQSAENKGEKVHIIGHIFPGGNCLKTWSWQYYKIINRYESTVVNQFFGHSHKDFFEMFYDEQDRSRPTNVVFVGPSVTTYTGLNPGYRIYTLDGSYDNSTQVVLDHENYYVNLTEANSENVVEWKFEYSAKAAYGMSSLRPADWNKVVQTFEKDDAMFNKFYNYFYKMHIPGPCDTKCKASHICALKSGRSHDNSFCAVPAGVTYEEMRIIMDKIGEC